MRHIVEPELAGQKRKKDISSVNRKRIFYVDSSETISATRTRKWDSLGRILEAKTLLTAAGHWSHQLSLTILLSFIVHSDKGSLAIIR